MKAELLKREGNQVTFKITVDNDKFESAITKAYNKNKGKFNIPGFRKGKAPKNMVKDKVNQVQVMDEAINGILPILYKEVLTEENLQPYAQPKVDVTKLSDVELEVKFVVVTAPEVELGQYKGLEM